MSAPASGQKVEWHDVQGLVLRGYGKHPYSANLLLQIDDSALVRKWLLSVSHRVTTSERAKNEIDHCYFNLAFTRSGLEKLELMQDWLAVFPASFLEGMDSENRSRILGDEKQSDPQNWEWGGPKTGVDVLVMIFGKDEDTLNHAIAAEQANLKGLSVKNDIRSQLWPDEKEHFGFHDGISQPVIESSPPPSHHQQNNHADGEYAPHNVIKAGEFVLGYKNEYGVLADPLNLPIDADPRQILFTVPMRDGSIAPDLGRNGTFLIVRQIRQHVAEFRSYLEQVGQTVQEREQIAAKIIGRWKSGAPLVTSPDKDDPNRCEQNEFLYHAIDPDGMRCPFGAHVRRANPRDMLGNDPKDGLTILKRHRLIRRGRSYGPRLADELDDKDDNELEDKADRGLLFMAINANIERQFEFIQQTWLRGVSFGGLFASKATASRFRWLRNHMRWCVFFHAKYSRIAVPSDLQKYTGKNAETHLSSQTKSCKKRDVGRFSRSDGSCRNNSVSFAR
jgi:Dyp-type peroxidase family